MYAQFALATPEQAVIMRRLINGEPGGSFDTRGKRVRSVLLNRKLIEFKYATGDRVMWSLTPEGRVALALREVLGPDRDLTASMAGYLTWKGLTPAAGRKLRALGLIDDDGERTEDGDRIRAILVRNGVRP